DGHTTNVLAVRADNSGQPASRWYTGAGIYRHVRLVVTNPVHIAQWGTFVTTPQVTAGQATVHVQSEVVNQSNVAQPLSLQVTLLDPDGRPAQTVATKIQNVAAGMASTFAQDISLKNPRRWDLDHPSLYRVAARVGS